MSALNQVKNFAITLSNNIFGSSKNKSADKNRSINSIASGSSDTKDNGSVRIIADKQSRPKQQLSDFTLF